MLPFWTFRRRWFALAVFWACAAAPAADAAENSRLHTVVEAEILGGYSEIPGRDGTFSTIDSWLLSPTLRVDDSTHWISLYNGAFNRSAQVVSTEEGGRESETTQSHGLSTSLRREIRDGWTLRPLLFADWIFVNETEDEDFGEGLYDYRQLGGGIESAWTTLRTDDRENELRAGFRYLNRQYPNYQSLISLFNPRAAPETDEKDLNGYKFNLAHRSRSEKAWSWGIEGIFFYKDYTDKKTIDNDGSLTGDGREDFVEQLSLFASRALNDRWTFAVDAQAAFNQSNLDFYDTHNTGSFVDDDFIKDYFDYSLFLVKPSIAYSQPWGEGKKLVWTADYSFRALLYPGRLAQNSAGVYGAEDQEDYAHTFSSRLSVPITPNVSWVAFGSYTIAESNQEFEAFYLYEYDLWTAVTGISFKY